MLLAFQGSAHAQTFAGSFPIDGNQEVPPSGSAATGTGNVTLDTSTNTLSWNISFVNLEGVESAAHFHGPAAAGANAGVQINIGTGNPKVGSTNVSGAQAADIVAGLWYVNIHSDQVPSGEIRGQVLVAPVGGTVPTMGEWGLATLAVLLLGAGAVIVRRRTAASAA